MREMNDLPIISSGWIMNKAAQEALADPMLPLALITNWPTEAESEIIDEKRADFPPPRLVRMSLLRSLSE
jgi:hypothetical protein